MDPLTIASLASAGGSVLGSVLSGGPETPDFVNPAIQAMRRRRAAANRSMSRRTDRLEADLAASGASGSGAAAQREVAYRANNDLQARLDSRFLDSINQARQQQERAEYAAQQQRSRARAQAVGNISGVVGMIAANQFGGGEEDFATESYGTGAGASNVDPVLGGDGGPAFASANPVYNTLGYNNFG